MQSKLTAPSAKELYFKAILLYLTNDDAIGAGQAMQRYLDKDPTFFQTRQQKFAQAVITSVKEQDLGLFSNEWYTCIYSALNSTRSSPSISGRPLSSPKSRLSYPTRDKGLLPKNHISRKSQNQNSDRLTYTTIISLTQLLTHSRSTN